MKDNECETRTVAQALEDIANCMHDEGGQDVASRLCDIAADVGQINEHVERMANDLERIAEAAERFAGIESDR